MNYSIYLSVEPLESPPALSQSWAGIYQKELSHGVWKRRLKLLLNNWSLQDSCPFSYKKARVGVGFGNNSWKEWASWEPQWRTCHGSWATAMSDDAVCACCSSGGSCVPSFINSSVTDLQSPAQPAKWAASLLCRPGKQSQALPWPCHTFIWVPHCTKGGKRSFLA